MCNYKLAVSCDWALGQTLINQSLTSIHPKKVQEIKAAKQAQIYMGDQPNYPFYPMSMEIPVKTKKKTQNSSPKTKHTK